MIDCLTLEYLRQIKEKEELAEKIRQDGLAESTRILSLAQGEAERILNQAHSEAEHHYDEAITKANEEAKEDYEKIIHGATWESDMISEIAKKNHEAAVSEIVKRILDPWQS